MNCPNCGSDNIKPVPYVYESGTMASSGLTLGAAFPGRHIVPFLAGSRNQAQSLFVQRLAPYSAPRHHRWLPKSLFILSSICFFLGVYQWALGARLEGCLWGTGFIVLLALSVFFEKKGLKEFESTKRAYADYYHRWQQSKVCLDCGHTFNP